MPEAHPQLQQVRSGMVQAVVGPHPLCRHLMFPILIRTKGCRGLGIAGSPQCHQLWWRRMVMEKNGEAALLAVRGDCWPGAVSQIPAWH